MASEYLTALNAGLWERLAYPSSRRSGGIGLVPSPPAGTPAAIRQADAEDLARVAYELAQGIAQGSIGGIPLRDHFKSSLEPLYGRRHNACQHAVADFLKSPHSHGVDMLGLRRGRSVVEAFGDFLDELALDERHAFTIRRDTLSGLIKTLTQAPEPGFVVADPAVFRTGAQSWVGFCDILRPRSSPDIRPVEPILFASSRRYYFSGRVSTAILAALLEAGDDPPSWVSFIGSDVIARAKKALREKGLLV